MSFQLKIAMGLNLGVALVCFIASGVYFFSAEITDYHKAVIGVDWASLPAGVKTMLIVLMKGTGNAVFVTALSITIFTLIPVRRGENWGRWATLATGLSCLLPMLVGASYLAITTNAPSPWWLNAILIAMLLAAFFMSSSLSNIKSRTNKGNVNDRP